MKKSLTLISVLLLAVCAVIVLTQPNKFQKFNSLRSSTLFEGQRVENVNNKLEVQPFLMEIPYLERRNHVYTVAPGDKYQQTILGGNGDCSNFSFGGAYHFIQNQIDFELVHFLPPLTFFSRGGHVAVRVPYNHDGVEGVGIVDLAGGGVPNAGSKIADISDLSSQDEAIIFDLVNEGAGDFYQTYYTKEYLSEVFIGFTPKSEVMQYFDFIDVIYIGLGNAKLEKMLYDGLAILFGQYYSIYVSDAFLEPFQLQIILFKSLLIVIRICLLALAGLLLVQAILFIRESVKS